MSKAANLTVRDIWHLVKVFFRTTFVLILVFCLPYALLLGTDFGIKTSFGKETASWVREIAKWGLGALLVYIVVTELPDILKRLGEIFTELGQVAQRTSVLKRILWISILAAYFLVLVPNYGEATLWFLILVIIPGAYMYDEYRRLIPKKDSREAEVG